MRKVITICKRNENKVSMFRLADLHHAADDHGEHVQRKTQDVEESKGHKGLLRIQNVLLVHKHVHGERRQCHLADETQKYMI